MKRRQWLRNDGDPSQVRASTFAVEESPVILVGTGLALTDTIGIEVRADAHTTLQAGGDYYWAPYYRNGVKIELRGDNNQLVFIVPGVYRLAGGPAPGGIGVALHEGEKISDDRIIFNDISNALMASIAPPSAATICPTAPLPDTETVFVSRCDALTKQPVTLVYSVTKANNAVCPPVAGGVLSLLGHIDDTGAFVSGPYPTPLGACGCSAAVELGELSSWG